MSSSRLYYEAVQSILSRKIAEGDLVTTRDIQKEVFGAAFNPDSRRQRELVYGAIIQGRNRCLDMYERYIATPMHLKDMAEVEYYKQDEMEKQVKNPDYGDFFAELKMGRFGDKTNVIETYLEAFVLIAAIWDMKMNELSERGDNLVIANYGPNSVWYIPSWWKWAIRETNLYLRTVRILERQFKRGKATGMLTSSGVPLDKALMYARSIRGVLEDGTTWQCRCGMYNAGGANYCSNCGKPRQDALPQSN